MNWDGKPTDYSGNGDIIEIRQTKRHYVTVEIPFEATSGEEAMTCARRSLPVPHKIKGVESEDSRQ